jgi:hypothetical protein
MLSTGALTPASVSPMTIYSGSSQLELKSNLNIDWLSKSLRISGNIVEKYISILEKIFIIKIIYSFHKNYKKEIAEHGGTNGIRDVESLAPRVALPFYKLNGQK